jgi:hypothetical protein
MYICKIDEGEEVANHQLNELIELRSNIINPNCRGKFDFYCHGDVCISCGSLLWERGDGSM